MSTYLYHGVPLTPAVFQHLVPAVLTPGETISRAALIERVVAEHQARGGSPALGAMTTIAKKALAALAGAGEMTNAAQGYWRRLSPMSPDQVKEPVVLGEGPESVYVYYFPAYRDQAAYLKRQEWPMKVGMTTGEVEYRVRDQCGTGHPERPITGMIYRTANARDVERTLHTILTERGRRVTDAPGKEWFNTSLEEIRTILDYVTGK